MFPSRILIIEDEKILAEDIKTFFDQCATDVRITSNAETAMEILQSFTPDLVVLDYALPGINGLRAYRNIVRVSPHPPRCILITEYLTDMMVVSAQLQGVRHILCKPFSFVKLQQAVVGLRENEPFAASFEAGGRVKELHSVWSL